MSFKQMLGQLVDRVPGAQGAIIVDWEGEAVDQAGRLDDYQLKVIGAHKGIILNILRAAIDRMDSEQAEEIIVTATCLQTLVLPVTPEYFLVLILKKGETLGRALFEARRSVQALRLEIA